MSTQKQIESNRANAQLSTGPVTAEGKAAVSQNRTTHGLNYNAATFKVLPCEDQSDYDNLLAQLQSDHKPTNFTEELFVISMAQHRWLFDRASRLQETTLDPATGQITDQKLFALYLRYASTHERAFHRCLTDLVKLRITKEKADFGFESQLRKNHKHDMDILFKQAEIDLRSMRTNHEHCNEQRAQWLFEKQKADPQAA